QHMRLQLLQFGILLVVIKVLKMAKTNMTGCQAYQRRCRFALFTPDHGLRISHTERTRGCNAEGVQVFTGEKFANTATQHRTTITTARKWRQPCTLEMHIPMLAGAIAHFSEQQATAIT